MEIDLLFKVILDKKDFVYVVISSQISDFIKFIEEISYFNPKLELSIFN